MIIRMRLMLGLFFIFLMVAGVRLAQIQWLEADRFRLKPYQNTQLEKLVSNAIQTADLHLGKNGEILIAPNAFTPYQTSYIQKLIKKGLIRPKDGGIYVENGFSKRVNPMVDRDPRHWVRGRILDRYGRPLAWSILADGRSNRHYALPRAAYPVIGSLRQDVSSKGLESIYDRVLRTPDPSFKSSWQGFWLGPHPGLDLITTVDLDLQRVAYEAMDGRKGAVVAIAPDTGDLLALVSTPSMSAEDPTRAWIDALDQKEQGPLPNRALEGFYAPGSTFKTLVAAAVLGDGLVSPSESICCEGLFRPLTGSDYTIKDHEYGTVEGYSGHNPDAGDRFNISQAYAVSCNVAFARLGALAGQARLQHWAEQFGFGRPIPIGMGGVEGRLTAIPSCLHLSPSTVMNDAQLAQTAIGQFEVRVTPMQMALVASAVANDGLMMRPRLVHSVSRPDGTMVQSFDPEPWRQAMPPRLAQQLKVMMERVVTEGTGHSLQTKDYRLAGKTGTAQVPGQRAHGWFIGFASAEQSGIAIAVVVENGGYGSSSAGRVARQVLDAWWARQ